MTLIPAAPAPDSYPASAAAPPRPPSPLGGGRDPVLHTKFLIPPPRIRRVLRPRLLDCLRAAGAPLVTLVAAPAGYGKTTLVADWILSDDRTAAWLTLDSADNDALPFWLTVTTALAQVQPAATVRTLALLRQPQPPALPTLLTVLLNELATQITPDPTGRPLLLVLDDYHTITDRAIHESVITFIARLPPHLRLVLTSRADPPLRLGRLRVRDQLLEIRAGDLAFAAIEVEQFLTETMGLTLPATVATTLLARTEGWAAALQLAALALRRQPDPAAFLADFNGSHRHLLGYLVEEVFSQQPPAVQAFLRATCILDRLCADLCDTLLAVPPPEPALGGTPPAPGGAQVLLEELEAANLFIVALDHSSEWYRYHPLFAEMLRYRLHQQDPLGEGILRRRASRWYEQAGDGAEAIRHALAAQDWDTAARQIERFADELRRRGELGLLDSWLTALPATAHMAYPGLGVWQALRLGMRGQFAAADAALAAVEQYLAHAPADLPADPPAARATLRGRALAMRIILVRYQQGDPVGVAAHARAALDQLPPHDLDWRAVVLDNLAAATYMSDDLPSAHRHYQTAVQVSEQAEFYLQTFISRARLGSLLTDQGALRAAHTYYEATHRQASVWGVLDLPLAGHIDWFAARLCYEADDLPRAAALVQRARARAEEGQLIELQGYAALTDCQIRLAQADLVGARVALDMAEACLTPPAPAGAPHNALLRAALGAWRATIYLAHPAAGYGPGATGEPALAEALPVAHWIWRAAQLLPARLYLQAGDAAAAHADLEQRSIRAQALGAQGLRITALALDALALEMLGRPAAARAALQQAILLGAAEGLCSIPP